MIPALLLLTALGLSYWLGVLSMLLSGWPWFAAIAFVLVRAKSGRWPMWWGSRALLWVDTAAEALVDMARDAVPTLAERFRERGEIVMSLPLAPGCTTQHSSVRGGYYRQCVPAGVTSLMVLNRREN